MAYLLLGLSLGLSAGLAPGPLLTLVVTRSLARGFWAGLRVALSPLITDAPIIVLSLLLFNALPPLFEQVVTVVGGLYVIYLGIDTILSARRASFAVQTAGNAAARVDLWQGALVNFLSPHPWLFWATIGAPALTRAWQTSPAYAAAFVIGFYALLVGGKIAVALAIAGGRRYLTDTWYRRLLAAAGALLCIFGFLLLWQLAPEL
jgi:threonine/homoserine/homoserine lactone efflux protein